MSITTKEANPKILNTRGSLVAEMKELPEAAAQSFVNGSLIYLDAAEEVTECGADPALIWGRALADASGVQGTLIPVEQFSVRDEIAIQCSDGADPITSDNVFIGTTYGVVQISDVWYIDTSEEAEFRLVVINRDIDPEDHDANDTWCRARFIGTYLQSEGSRA